MKGQNELNTHDPDSMGLFSPLDGIAGKTYILGMGGGTLSQPLRIIES